MKATLFAPNGQAEFLILRDDGDPNHGDEEVNDGVYSAKVSNLGTYGNGSYRFTVSASSQEGQSSVVPGEAIFGGVENDQVYESRTFSRSFDTYVQINDFPRNNNDLDDDGLDNDQEEPGDADGDGKDNKNDRDSDNDDISDGDGRPNYLDLDSDGDGIEDTFDPNPYEANTRQSGRYAADFLMGSYLFSSDYPFDPEIVYGVRLGYYFTDNIQLRGEFIASQMEESQERNGLMIQANGLFQAEFGGSPFRAYLQGGVGYTEFRAFFPGGSNPSGISYLAGVGLEFPFSGNLRGFVEGRYMNLSSLDFDPNSHYGILWGVRTRF